MKYPVFSISCGFIVVLLFFQGCATYKQVKELDVNNQIEIQNVKSEMLSECVWELMKEEGDQIYHHSFDPIRNKWFVISEFKTLLGSGNGIYNYSISFEDINNSTSRVQIRSLKTAWGSPEAPVQKIFENAKKCSNSFQKNLSN